MFTLYLFALLVGGGLLAFSLVGDSDSDSSHDHAPSAWQWLSLRTLTYFLFVFGGVGAVLARTWHAAAAPLVLLLAVVAGLAVGGAASAAFAYLRRTDSGNRSADDTFVGLTARVTLPITRGGKGKVMVQRGDRTFELLARSLDVDAGNPSRWKSVIIVEMHRGTALVSPLDDPSYKEISSLSQSQE
ncbi:MAG: hypothetical protein WD801_06365 [Gemmatimonadaceae bacterium]